MRLIVGVDLGGTNIALYGRVTEPTPVADGPDAVVEHMVGLVRRSLDETRRALGVARLDVAGVGVGAPGPLDTQRGVVLLAPNLGWHDMPLRARIGDATGLEATLDNDANCATLGEWWRGAARGGRFVIGLTIGTCIGGGIVLDGRIYHGASDVAAEFGHTTIDATGRRCACGNYGCLEAYASGPNIAKRAVEELASGRASAIPGHVGDDLSLVTAQTVYAAAAAGDELALEIVRDTAKFLGVGVANFVNILNPDVVVITGGVTQAGDRLFAPLRMEVGRRAFKPAVDACRIVPGTLSGTAGVYGAAAAFTVQHRDAV
jgi:glucokinase